MKVLQLTNKNILAVAENSYMPLGITTVKYQLDNCNYSCPQIFTVTSSVSDTLVVNKGGTYRLDYSASLMASAIGTVTLNVLVNGVSMYTVSATATAASDLINLTIPLDIYIPCNCNSAPNSVPANIQIQNTGVALTGGTSNLIITKY